jgi:hypothetical protein
MGLSFGNPIIFIIFVENIKKQTNGYFTLHD